MKILILGGTRFVGLRITEAAVAAGHDVTIFHRGKTNPAGITGAHSLIGDHHADLTTLREGTWDAVIDVSGYVPGEVRATAEALRGHARQYVFISTVSVYQESIPAGADEDAALLEISEEIDAAAPNAYGGQKVNCEKALHELWDGVLTIVRPTFVVGADDYTDRFTYWVRRVAQGGRVVVTQNLDQALQFIDARDLAAFTVHLAETSTAGTFNAIGSPPDLTVGSVIDAIMAVSASHIDRVPVSDAVLEAAGVKLPLIASGSGNDAMLRLSNERARAAGLRPRAMNDVIRDLLAWDRERGLPPLVAGPDPDVEARLAGTTIR